MMKGKKRLVGLISFTKLIKFGVEVFLLTREVISSCFSSPILPQKVDQS